MRPVMGAKSLWTPRELAEMVPVGAEEVIQPLLKSPPMVAIGELHVDEAELALGASAARAAADAVAADGAAGAVEAEAADGATAAVAAAGAAPAAEALPAAGASGALPEEDPKKGIEPHPAAPRARTVTTVAMSAVERMVSPQEAL